MSYVLPVRRAIREMTYIIAARSAETEPPVMIAYNVTNPPERPHDKTTPSLQSLKSLKMSMPINDT